MKKNLGHPMFDTMYYGIVTDEGVRITTYRMEATHRIVPTMWKDTKNGNVACEVRELDFVDGDLTTMVGIPLEHLESFIK